MSKDGVSSIWQRANSFYSGLIKLFFILFSLLIIYFAFKGINKEKIVMDNFSVPFFLQSQGYSGKEVTRQLADEIFKISEEAKSYYKDSLQHQYDPENTAINVPDMQIPGMGFSLLTIRNFLHEAFGKASTNIGGSLITTDKEYSLTVRISGKPSKTFANTERDIDALMHEAAKYVLLNLDARVLLVYYEAKLMAASDSDETIISEIDKNKQLMLEFLNQYGTEENQVDIAILSSDLGQGVNTGAVFANQDYALKTLSQAIEKSPKDVYLLSQYGTFLTMRGGECNGVYEKVVNLAPNYLQGYVDYDNCLEKLARESDSGQVMLEAQLKLWNTALNNIDPCPDCLLYKGDALKALNKIEEARGSYQELTLDPSISESLRNQAQERMQEIGAE